MRIGVVYTGLVGYMVDCWRELSRRSGIVLRVWDEETEVFNFKGNKKSLLNGIDCQWVKSESLNNQKLESIVNEIVDFKPDIIFVCGWARRMPPYVASSLKLKDVPMVLDMDMPWELSARKIIARFVLRRRLRRFSAVFVPGMSSARYARWLGFSEDRIFKGRYCIDIHKFRAHTSLRSGFLFVGRHVPEKGLDILKKAFFDYKRLGGGWDLTILDFVEPDKVPAIMRNHACLILPSRFEPWGVVVLEALASGMKTIVSDCVGARFDLPVDEVFKSGDCESLTKAMIKVDQRHKHESHIRSETFDLSYFSTSAWVDRLLKIYEKIC